MPVYVYACATCGHRFETRQGFYDAALTSCPECAGTIRRVVQPVGIVFKGSGFYRNDSRASSETSAPAAERKPEGALASGDAPAAASPTGAPSPNGATPTAAANTAPAAGSTETKSKATPAATSG